MPFTEFIKQNPEQGQEDEGPFDINSPDKLDRFLSMKEPFAQNFYLENGHNEELVDKLNENDNRLIYRGMPPKYIFKLINGKKINIRPYRFEDVTPDTAPEEDVQNASFYYSNAIMHGSDDTEKYNFLTTVGFKQNGFAIGSTGVNMVERLTKGGEFHLVPDNREKDITIEGELDPKNIEIYCFRFIIDGKEKTLVYRRRQESKKEESEKKQDWASYMYLVDQCVSKNDAQHLEFLLSQPHPLLPGEREAYLWLKKNAGHRLGIKLDKSRMHVVPVEKKKKIF